MAMALFRFGLLLPGRKRNGRSRTCAFIERRFCLVNWLERRRVETHVGWRHDWEMPPRDRVDFVLWPLSSSSSNCCPFRYVCPNRRHRGCRWSLSCATAWNWKLPASARAPASPSNTNWRPMRCWWTTSDPGATNCVRSWWTVLLLVSRRMPLLSSWNLSVAGLCSERYSSLFLLFVCFCLVRRATHSSL